MSTNPFVLDRNEYKRDINPIKQYIEQAASYLSIMNNTPIQDNIDFVTNIVKNNVTGKIKDPKVVYLQRKENGDREKLETTLNTYINESLANHELISPTLTTYLNPKIKKSILVENIEYKIKLRGVAKKAMFAADASGDIFTKSLMDKEQTNHKLSNNALSGAHVSASTPMFNKTAHSTLTSTCRSTSGYGNANNEKLLSGNRHYWSPSSVLNNIVSILSNTDYELLDKTMSKYIIHYPSVRETMDVIKSSTSLYWSGGKGQDNITNLVCKLTPIQRAAFLYTGDFYSLMRFNENLTRTFIKSLSQKVKGEYDNPLKDIKSIHEDYLILAHQICESEMKGKGKDYKALENSTELKTLLLTAKHAQSVIEEYADLIKTFLVTKNVPASVAYFPDSIRKAALTSDTDSTIFTVQDWITWYMGEMSFSEEANAVAAAVVFIASQSIIHILAMMSANFGIGSDRIHQIAMKNEFKFDVFVPTQIAKHYYATIGCQEGNVYETRKNEIKGVHLKSSNAPKRITDRATNLMDSIIKTTLSGKKISILEVFKIVADTEREIIASVMKGDNEFFRLAQIKPADSYKKEADESPYKHYLFWEEVFAPKYGSIPKPPYTCIKVPTVLETPALTAEWIAKIKDPDIKARVTNWFNKNKVYKMPTMYLPVELIDAYGIPEELHEAIGIRKMVSDLTNIFYIILETLGFYIRKSNSIKLISDTY
jgi:hypothetical protein